MDREEQKLISVYHIIDVFMEHEGTVLTLFHDYGIFKKSLMLAMVDFIDKI